MLNKIRKLWFLISHYKLIRALLDLAFNGYLKDMGWINSFIKNKSIDLDSNPIPWVAYPFIVFFAERLNKNMNIFEFGSGNSTLFYASRVSSVIVVEHDKEWYSNIKKTIPPNVNIHYVDLVYDGLYSKFINTLNTKFDIVIVDGRDRVNCIKNSIKNLAENGVIILDNSEVREYSSGLVFLTENGFKKIDFWGIAAGYNNKTCTTLFYKENNCLGI
ncbi:hypothetical protein MEO93_28215 [Dolichospermum sp. ST_sed3]|nr:hypothetical protein [Dolichospermum sp. ST_sed3]